MKKEYENILSYVKSNLKTFQEMPLNELDSLAFCSLSYLYLDSLYADGNVSNSLTIKDLTRAEHFDPLFRYYDEMEEYFGPLLGKDYDSEASRDLLLYMAASPRYRDVRISFYTNAMDDAQNLQFGAMTFSLSDEEHYCAFRGTDWDIIGWKEDLLLALPEPIRSQYEAVAYLERLAGELKGRIYVGGHSKGGNLAVYGAAKCSSKVQDRIPVVFSHDGPGFHEDFLKDEGLLAIRDRIQKTSPHSSYVAQLLNADVEPKYVDSLGVALTQHYPLFWKVEGDSFLTVPEQSLISHAAISKVNDDVLQMTDEQRSYLIETIFIALSELHIHKVGDFDKKLMTNVQMILKTLGGLDPQRKAFVHQLLKQFVFGIKLEDMEDKETMEETDPISQLEDASDEIL